MINAYWEELEFNVQEGTAQEWKRIVDTALPSPDDFSDDGIPLQADEIPAGSKIDCGLMSTPGRNSMKWNSQ